MRELSLNEARRTALAAQGFARARQRRVTADDVARTIRQLALVQIDYANVVVPSHYMVLFSRLGRYDRALLDEVVFRKRQFTEQWAHEASIVPMETWPLLRHRMAQHRVRPYPFAKFFEKHRDYAEDVLEQVRQRGPVSADAVSLPHPEGSERYLDGAWFRSVPRAVLEAHFGRGLLAIAGRRQNFSRTYDLAERVIAPEHFGRDPAPEDAQRELLRQAARACGVGTAADLADYFRMPVRDARPRIAELVDAGELEPLRVENWREPAFLHRDATLPRRVEAAALLSPFDSLIWFRPRLLRLFHFDYRFEIFTPPAKRRWGAYVLPFLLGERLVARVDVKADREQSRLLVPAAFLEAGVAPEDVAIALATELRKLASWLGLNSVAVLSRSQFGRLLWRSLQAALAAQRRPLHNRLESPQ